ncbi:hypothetical protein LTR85_003557 [Meristemomyces frigidus]|nr:hypothetical protein LTR85_003557 [Meristemomyces frigidus]
MNRRYEGSNVDGMDAHDPRESPPISRLDSLVTTNHSDLGGVPMAIDNLGASTSGLAVSDSPGEQLRSKVRLTCIEAPNMSSTAEAQSAPQLPVGQFIEQVFELSQGLALVGESVMKTNALIDDLDDETTTGPKHHADQNHDGRPRCAAKIMNLPEEIAEIILDNLPFFQDQIPLAVVSIESRQNGIAKSVLKRWRHQLFENPVLRVRLFTGPAFKGEKSVPDRVAVGLLSRGMREGTDKPSMRTQRLLGFKSGDRTYQDLLAELDDTDSDTFAGQWVIWKKHDMREHGIKKHDMREHDMKKQDTKKRDMKKHDMKMALKAARDAEEDVRYFKPRGKASTLIHCLNHLIIYFKEVEPAWLSVSPDIDPLCTNCASIECEDKMINVAFLETIGIVTPHSTGVWPKRVILGNSMSYFSKQDADRLSALQYGVPYNAWTAKYAGMSNADQRKTLKDAARFSVCFAVLLQHVGNIDVSGYAWFRTIFTFANSRYGVTPPDRYHNRTEWIRSQVALTWHNYLRGRLNRISLGFLRSFMHVVRLPEIESLMPTKSHVLDDFSCTLEHIDMLCESIHDCSYAGLMMLTAEMKTKNLSRYFAQMACLLKAIHMYDRHAPKASQACADLLALFSNNQASQWAPQRRLKMFCDVASVTHFRSFCRQNFNIDGGHVFNALHEVPDDIALRAAVSFWASPIFGEALHQQLTAWAPGKIILIDIPAQTVPQLPAPLQLLITTHRAIIGRVPPALQGFTVHRCGTICWVDADEVGA